MKKKIPYKGVGEHRDRFEDEGTIFSLREANSPIVQFIRVGQVFYKKPSKHPGAWLILDKQQILISPKTWKSLKRHVDGQLRRFKSVKKPAAKLIQKKLAEWRKNTSV